MEEMFYGCSKFNQDISDWNVINVGNFDSMFEFCPLFNIDIRGWTLKEQHVILTDMFFSATAFVNKFNSSNSDLIINTTSGTPTIGFFDVSNTSISDINVNAGWNLLNITGDGELSGSTIQAIYEYNVSTKQYFVIADPVIENTPTSVTTNTRYMVKTNSNSTITFTTVLYQDATLIQFNFADNGNIVVTSGWNIIGWNSTSSADLGTMVDSSELIIANTLHEYNAVGYNRFGLQVGPTSIKANRGYWVKCSGSGTLEINKNT